MYNRQAAVQYANLWWNRRNPAFPNFTVDCTNYISQCLLAGGAPMRGAPNRGKGWWVQHGNGALAGLLHIPLDGIWKALQQD